MPETVSVSVEVPGLTIVGTPSDGDTLVYNATSGQWEPGVGGGGGGSFIDEVQEYSRFDWTLADDALTLFSWLENNGPGHPLDLTDPQNPTAIETGIYAVSAQVSFNALPVDGKAMWAALELDAWDQDYLTEATNSIGSGTVILGGPASTPQIALSLISKIPAGGVINLSVQQNSGDAAPMTTRVCVQRVG